MQITKDIFKIIVLLAVIVAGYGVWREQQLARQAVEREVEFKSSQSCSEAGEKFWRKQMQNPLLIQPSVDTRGFSRHTEYTSHFNKVRNKCFVEVTEMIVLRPDANHISHFIGDPPVPNYDETNYYLYDSTESQLVAVLQMGFTATAPQQQQYTLIREEKGKPASTTNVGIAVKELNDKYQLLRASLMKQ